MTSVKIYVSRSLKFLKTNIRNTVEPLKTDTPRDKYKCPSYRGVRLMEVIFNRNNLLGQ